MNIYRNGRPYFIIILLGVMSWLIYLSFDYLNAARQNEKLVTHSYEVLLHVEKLKFRVQQLSPSFRNFEVTGAPFFKDLFHDHAKQAFTELSALQQLTVDNPVTQHLLAIERNELKGKIAIYNNRIFSLNYPYVASTSIVSTVPSIVTEYDVIEKSELKLLSARQQNAGKSKAYFKVLISFNVAISFLAVLYLL